MDAIEHLLTRGVDHIYPTHDELEKVLRSGKKLRLYQGFDPTGVKLHIGHAVAIRKLRQFQDLGHHVIFVIGDGTGQAGDPSGKTKSREKFMTRDELRANARDYVAQAGKIVRFDGDNPVEILYNGDWLNKLGLVEILDIAGYFTLAQMLERDLYQERMKSGTDLSLREFMYPLLQGYDSVAMKVDLELGGTDQTFNMLAGRKLVRAMQGREKFVMTVPLLTDAKGVKIGKTEGNVIGLTDEPNEFYGKIMALGDDAILPCFTLLTDLPQDEIDAIGKKMKTGENPMQFKKQLALELTKQFNSEKAAETAQEAFKSTHQESAFPEQATPSAPANNLKDFLVDKGYSANEARRLIESGSLDINGVTIKEINTELEVGDKIKVGKKKFFEIKELV
jgi:tyrosyl-tRNA synthetase